MNLFQPCLPGPEPYQNLTSSNPTSANPTSANPTSANPTSANPTFPNPTFPNPDTSVITSSHEGKMLCDFDIFSQVRYRAIHMYGMTQTCSSLPITPYISQGWWSRFPVDFWGQVNFPDMRALRYPGDLSPEQKKYFEDGRGGREE